MPRLAPLTIDTLSDGLKSRMKAADQIMGFTSNDSLTMARNPDLFVAVSDMVNALYSSGTVDIELKRLVANVASNAAGCQYCVAHTAHGAHMNGTSEEKLNDLWSYDTSPHFTERERTALRVAQGAGMSPSQVTDEQFEDLKEYFTDDEIVEIVGIISLFGFLNRWNSTFATDLESSPMSLSKKLNMK